MNVTKNTFAELKSYLTDLQSLVTSVPLGKKLYKEGTTIGQVAFHIPQSANFYLRKYILKEKFERNRSKEFTTNHSIKEITKSIQKALDACEEIIIRKINLDDQLKEIKTVHSRRFDISTVYEAIQHVVAHTAEHYGEIKIAHDHF